MTSRAVRLAENETLVRAINERLTGRPDHRAAAASDKVEFYCECGAPDCFERVSLTGAQYEAVRTDSARFVVAPGHVFTEVEQVVEEHDGYLVVEKKKDVRDIVEQTDPRRGPAS